jgi:hypothetical protein
MRTEGRFKGWVEDMEKVGWESVVGQPPSEQQFIDALRKKDLVVYVLSTLDPDFMLTTFLKIFRPWRCRTVPAVSQNPQPASLCSHHALGMLIGHLTRNGRL